MNNKQQNHASPVLTQSAMGPAKLDTPFFVVVSHSTGEMPVYTLEAPGQLHLHHGLLPRMVEGGVLMKVLYVSICATDVGYFTGSIPSEQWPLIPGHEVVGEIIESDAPGLKVGDIVTYWGATDFGGLAPYRGIVPVLPGENKGRQWWTRRGFMDDSGAAVAVVPSQIPYHLASLLETVTSVLRSTSEHPVEPGERVVVLGAGPVGLIALQIYRNVFGAKVTAIDKNALRLRKALELGADAIFDPIIEREALDRLAADTQGSYANLVFDALPDLTASPPAQTRDVAMHLLARGHRYVVFGATEIPQSISWWLILSKGLKLSGTAFDVRQFPMARSAEVLQHAIRLVTSGSIALEALVTHRVSFFDEVEVERAFTEHGKGSRLKTVVRVAE